MCKRFFIVLFSISMLVANQVEHDYNSAVPTFTKVPHPGRMNIEISLSNSSYSNQFIGTQNISLDNSYSISKVEVNGAYHGTNGIGLSGSQIMENESINNGSRITTTAAIYMVWNEIYPDSSPSMLDGHQFTFPSTRILTGLSVFRMKDFNNNYCNAASANIAMDLIISNTLILTNNIDLDLQDNNDFIWSTVSSKLIYDITEKITVAPSISYRQDNSGYHETNIMIEAGYQYKDLNYGYLHTDAKISPFVKFNIFGQDVIYADTEFGANFYFFFN